LCNKDCWQYRTFARCTDIENPEPFTFIFDKTKFEKKIEKSETKESNSNKSKQDDDYSAYDEAIEELKKEKGKNLNTVFRNYSSRYMKYSKTNIIAMYICIMANGSIENLYIRLRDYNSSINIDAFKRRVRFIIKFEEEPIDPHIGIGDVIHIFEKENKQDFNNRIFDIEFNKNTILEQVKAVTVNLGVKGKFRAINEFEVNIIDNTQATIQEYLLSENDLFEDNILNISEDSL
ncbi:17707_t:CDS:2, partial [Dentiscutata erythropus]